MVLVASLFNQLLHHFPRAEFASLVNRHSAERAAKGFTCWTQFVSMTFCQLAHADSLREICNGLNRAATAQLAPGLIVFLFGSFPVASQRLFEPTYDARTSSRMLAERTR